MIQSYRHHQVLPPLDAIERFNVRILFLHFSPLFLFRLIQIHFFELKYNSFLITKKHIQTKYAFLLPLHPLKRKTFRPSNFMQHCTRRTIFSLHFFHIFINNSLFLILMCLPFFFPLWCVSLDDYFSLSSATFTGAFHYYFSSF